MSQNNQGSNTSQNSNESTIHKDKEKSAAKSDEKKGRTLLNILPKLPSSDSLSNSPGPGSPGKKNLNIFPKFSHSFWFLSGPGGDKIDMSPATGSERVCYVCIILKSRLTSFLSFYVFFVFVVNFS